MLRAGTAFFAVACLMACSEIRPPKIMEFETTRSQMGIVKCLEGKKSFSEIKSIGVGTGRGGGGGVRVHILDRKHHLIVNDRWGEDGKVQIRSEIELTKSQVKALRECV